MLYIILALLFYTAAIMTGALASRMANSTLVTASTNIISAIIPTLLVLPLLNKQTLEESKLGIFIAVLCGLAVALFTISLNKSFTMNKVAIVMPIVMGGAIFLSALLSYFFFKEKISLVQGLGLTLLGIGLIVIIYARATGK